MGRNNTDLLPVPGYVPATTPEPPPAVAEEPAAAAVPTAELTSCPHCGEKLSALDIKMNTCFKCRMLLVTDTTPAVPSGRGAFEVSI
ncbi:hypothetical protein JW859_10515 [bacterium]|nr:hypothetical protein [bacterium]